MLAVRLGRPHCGKCQQKVAGIRRSEGGFAENRRREGRESSLRQKPATHPLTAANPSNNLPCIDALIARNSACTFFQSHMGMGHCDQPFLPTHRH